MSIPRKDMRHRRRACTAQDHMGGAAPPDWGEYVAHSHASRKNVINALICLCVLAPSIVATWAAYSRCNPDSNATATLAEAACSCAMGHPIAFANLLFFLNVSLLFWLIGLAQRSLCEAALKPHCSPAII